MTNFSVNKKSSKFVKNADQKGKPKGAAAAEEDEDDDDGANSSKWDFRQLRRAYQKQGLNFSYVMA